ncbi:putative T7SS-secreted protein [Streptomyces sp. SID3343]|uniref:putative T7SS-secreted protein n=1 Tax=Streptomyces sp. SID3343 TaxID=2690260 RepID=UPI00136C6700|nr:hypothetical protein [Streptomyces sp. SID3343]MYW00197.1 hypothetical protein [Streptomyces sp. SID3343]
MTTDADYPALGFDPAPGNVEAMGTLVDTLTRVGTQLQQTEEVMTSIGKSGMWEGDAAKGFGDNLGPIPKYLADGRDSISKASTQLHSWQSQLGAFQTKAKDFEAQAAAAKRALLTAKDSPDFQLAGKHFDTDAALHDAEAKLKGAQDALNKAQGSLDSIIDQAKRLRDEHDRIAEEIARIIRDAASGAPNKPGMWDKIKGAVANLGEKMKNLAKNIGQWIKDNADVINRVCDVIGDIGAGLQIVGIALAATGIAAPLGGALLGIGAGFSGVALVGHAATLAAGGGGSWKEWGPRLLGDTLGVLPGVGAIKGGAKALQLGAKQGNIFGKILMGETGGKLTGNFMRLGGKMKNVVGDVAQLSKTGLATLEGMKISMKIPHIKEYWLPQNGQQAAFVGGAGLLGGPGGLGAGLVGNAFYNAVHGGK